MQILYGREKLNGWPLSLTGGWRFSFNESVIQEPPGIWMRKLERHGARPLLGLGVGLLWGIVGCINQHKDTEREEEV